MAYAKNLPLASFLNAAALTAVSDQGFPPWTLVAFEKAPQNFYEGDMMDIVCASPFAHQVGSVLCIRRSFWGGSGDGSAVYLE